MDIYIDALKRWLESSEHWLVPLGELAAIVAACASVVAFFWRNVKAGAMWLLQRRPRITFGETGSDSTQTRLTFVFAEGSSFWHAERASQPGMLLVAEWFVTNLSRGSVRILAARFARPKALRTQRCIAHIETDDEPLSRPPQQVLISRGETILLSLRLMTASLSRYRDGRSIKVRCVVVDQHQHEHRTPLAFIPNR